VSEDVDARIREQIANGVFPVRLKQDEWNSGKINWLLDVVANDPKTVPSVIRNFRAVAKEGDLRLHPIIARMIDAETLEKLGAKRAATPQGQRDGGSRLVPVRRRPVPRWRHDPGDEVLVPSQRRHAFLRFGAFISM
jgi:hypothetical protein